MDCAQRETVRLIHDLRYRCTIVKNSLRMLKECFVDLQPALGQLERALEEAQLAGVEQRDLQDAIYLLETAKGGRVTVMRINATSLHVFAREVEDLRHTVAERLEVHPNWVNFCVEGSGEGLATRSRPRDSRS